MHLQYFDIIRNKTWISGWQKYSKLPPTLETRSYLQKNQKKNKKVLNKNPKRIQDNFISAAQCTQCYWPQTGWMDPAVLTLNWQDEICLVLHHKFQLRGFTDCQARWRARTLWGTQRNLICSTHRSQLTNPSSPESLQYSLPAWGGRICSFEKQGWQNGKAARSCHELLKNYLGSLQLPSLGIPHQKASEFQTLFKLKRLQEKFLLQPGRSKTHWK